MAISASDNKKSTARHDPPGIPDHEMLHLVGSGAYGEVWLARNAVGTYRAVKVVWRADFKSERPYEREFSGMLKFEPVSRSHEGFVDILQVGRNDEAGYFYYVMELADNALHAKPSFNAGAQPTANPASASSAPSLSPASGYLPRTLSSEARAAIRISPSDCLRYFLTLTDALAGLHQAGLIHRDIKPSNIILVGGVAKLADIGLVAALDSERSFVGTEGFIPPEGPGTVRSDIYSLGKVLYEVATGNDRMEFPSLPFDAATGRMDDFLLELNAILTRACAPSAADRYDCATEMHAELALLQSGRSVKRMRVMDRRLKMAVWAGRVAFVLAILGLFLAAFFSRQTKIEKENLRRSEQLRQEREIALVEADLERASAERQSGRVGRRTSSLNALTQAADLRGPNAALRGEAVTSLALVDLQPEKEIDEPNANATVQHALSPDFNQRAVAETNGDIVLRRVRDNAELSRWRGDKKMARWVGPFSADGHFLAIYTGSRDVVVREVPNGRELLRVPNEPGWNNIGDAGWWVARGFSPDSRFFAVVHANAQLSLYDLKLGTVRQVPLPHPVSTLAFEPDGQSLALASKATNNQLTFVDLATDAVRVVSLPTPHGVFSLAWSPDSLTLAAGAGDAQIYLLDGKNPDRIRSLLTGHEQVPVALAFHPGGHLLLSSGWDGTTRLWDVTEGKQVAELPNWGWDFVFAKDGSRLAYYDAELGSLKLFFVADRVVCRQLLCASNKNLRQVAFAPDGSWIAACSDDALRFFDTDEGREIASLPGSANGMALFQTGTSNGMSAWRLMTLGEELARWDMQNTSDQGWHIAKKQHLDAPRSEILLNSGQSETYGVYSRQIGLWIFNPGQNPLMMDGSKLLQRLALSPNGQLVASTGFRTRDSTAPEILVWDTHTGHVKWSQPTRGRGGVAFSADNQYLATTSQDGVTLWDLAANRMVWRTEKPGGVNSEDCLVFSPDGKSLALTLNRHQAGILNAATGELLTRIEHPDPRMISYLAFSPDGGQLAVGCEKGRVQLWDLRALRRELAELKLDWNLPHLPSAPARRHAPQITIASEIN